MKGPLVFLADSQLLFAGPNSVGFHAWLRLHVAGKRGVYLGASNGDVADFYQMGRDAFTSLGGQLDWQSMHESALSPDYDFYLLAGGDVALGWRYLSLPEVNNALQLARDKGALFLGVSAGAMHLAHAFTAPVEEAQTFLDWLTAVVAVHEEHQHWPTLQHWRRCLHVQTGQSAQHGKHVRTGQKSALPLLCIPMGGGLLWLNERAYALGKGAQWHAPDGGECSLPALDVIQVSQPIIGAAERE